METRARRLKHQATDLRHTAGEAVALRVTKEQEIEILKSRLIIEALSLFRDVELGDVQQAANESASLAWLTPFPMLVFPQLFREKMEAAVDYKARQLTLLNRTGLIAHGGPLRRRFS